MTEKKINILFITNALEVGGAEKFLLDLIKHLDRTKFNPSLATVIGGGSLEPDFQALNLPIYIHGRQRLRYLGGLKQFWQLYKLIKKIQPDIVHTQLFAADLWGRLAAALAGVKLIVTTEQNVNLDQSWLRETLKKWTYRLTVKVVAISTAVKNYAHQKYTIPLEKIEIIPNDVDLEKWEQRIAVAPTKKTDKKILITTGRLVPQKGQTYLLSALALLPAKYNYELWIVGGGPLKTDLEKQAQKLGLENKVKFLGTRHDVPELLAQADIFVFSSIFEGLGIAVLEAAIAKLPIVASKIDGLLDIIQDGQSGLLVEPKNPAALAQAIETMLEHPEQAKAMAEQAYNYVKNNFEVKVITQRYQKLFTEIYYNKK